MEPNNFTLNTEHSHDPLEKTITLTSLTLVTVCASFGNLYILICILGHSELQRPRHLFLASLAITDMLLAIIVMVPRLSDEILGKWPFGYFLCQVNCEIKKF